MDGIIRTLNAILQLLFSPLNAVPPFWGLLIISIVTGLIMITIAARTSDQQKLKSVKNQLKADLLAMRLYQYDATVMLRTISGLFRNNLHYMRHLLKPMIFLVLPVSLIMIQLASRYAYRPAAPGETLLISASYDSGVDPQSLHISPERITGAGPVRILPERTVYWRTQPFDIIGTEVLTFSVDTDSVQVPVAATPGNTPIGSNFYRAGDYRGLLDPAASALPRRLPIRHIRIHYQGARIPVGTAHIHWLPFFFIVSILSGLVLKKLLGITL